MDPVPPKNQLVPPYIDPVPSYINVPQCPSGQCPSQQVPKGQCPLEQCPSGQLFLATMSLATMSLTTIVPRDNFSSVPLQLVIFNEDGSLDDQNQGDGGAGIVSNDNLEDPATSVPFQMFVRKEVSFR